MAGVPKGFEALHQPERFTFVVSSAESKSKRSAKGYAFREEAPALLVTNLATCRHADDGSFTVYRHIKGIQGRWYLCFTRETLR